MGPIFIPRGNTFLGRGFADGSAVSATFEGICEWDLATRAIRRRVRFPRGLAPLSVSLAGDVFFNEGNALHVWRRATGARERLMPLTPDGGSMGTRVSLSADGTHVALPEGDQVAVIRLSDGARIAALPMTYASFSLAHGGRWVLFQQDVSAQSGSGWTDYAVVETATGKDAGSAMLIGDDASVGLSSDGLAVEYTGRVEGSDVLDASIPRTIGPRALPGARWADRSVPFAIAFGRALTWCGHQLLDVGADRPLLGSDDRVKGAALAPDGSMLALMLFEAKGVLRPTADPSARRPFTVPKALYPDALAVLPGGRLAFASRGRVDWDDGTTVALADHPVSELAASRDGRVLAVRCGYRGRWLGPFFVLRGTAVQAGPAIEAHCLALRPDGSLLAISTDAGIEVWETASLTHVKSIPAERALALAFAEDGLRLHALHDDLTVRAYPD